MHKYPDDGGLKEPVRPFGEGFSAFDVIRRHFTTEPAANGFRDSFRITHIPGLYYHAHNVRAHCGHIRLFGKPNKGWIIYSYGRQVPGDERWAEHRKWNLGLFCIHHVEPGKDATDPEGWHITWASLTCKREYRGFTIRFQAANTFKCAKEPKPKRRVW